MADFAAIRRNMVDTQLRTYDVTSKRLLDAVESVGREHFVPEAMKNLAYVDQQIKLSTDNGHTRVLLQPMVLARMIQALDIQIGDKALDIAGGSGYSGAIMAAMGCKVTVIEASDQMLVLAKSALEKAGIEGITLKNSDLDAGSHEDAPFDVILVNGAVESIPVGLTNQLADGGRLVVVVGTGRAGRVMIFNKTGGSIGRRNVFDASAPMLSSFSKKIEFQF